MNGRATKTATGTLGAGVYIDCASPQAGLIWTETAYDKRGRTKTEWTARTSTDPGFETTYEYDLGDRVTKVVGPAKPSVPMADRPTVVHGYDATGAQDATTDIAGRTVTTETAYSAGGRVVTEEDVSTGLKTRSVFDPVTGLLDKVYGPAPDPTAAGVAVVDYEYDADGRVTTVTHPEGDLVRTLSYDAAGRPLLTEDPAGVQTQYVWSKRGDLVHEITAAGTADEVDVHFEEYRFDGQPTKVRDGKDNLTTYVYNARGERLTRVDAYGKSHNWRYDTAGRLRREEDALLRATTMGYDAHGRLEQMLDPTNRTTTYTLRPDGQPSSVAFARPGTPGESETFSFAYDDLGRRDSATDSGGVTDHDYDKAGRLTRLARPDGRVMRWGYDAAGRPERVTHPDGTALRYQYDPATGRLSSIRPELRLADTFTSPNGGVDTAKWTNGSINSGTIGVENNTAKLTVPDVANARAGIGHNTAATVADGSVGLRYRFDDNTPGGELMVLQRIDGTRHYRAVIANTSSTGEIWRRNGAFNVKVGEFAVNADTSWQNLRFEVQGDQMRARHWADTETEPATWDVTGTDSVVTAPGNLRVSFTRTAGAHTAYVDDVSIRDLGVAQEPALVSYQWDKQGRLRAETLPDGTRSWDYTDGQLTSMTQTVPNLSRTTALGYDDAGRLQSETVGADVTTYDYDQAGQLTTVASPGFNASYGYDNVGRRTAKTVNGASTSYTYDVADQLTASTGAEAGSYSYNAAGQLLTETMTGSANSSYTYDVAGRLKTLTRGGGGASAGTVVRSYDPDGTLTAVTNQGSGLTTALNWDPTQPVSQLASIAKGAKTTTVAGIGSHWAAKRQGSTATGFAVDPDGSVIATPATADLAAASGYDPWGNPTVEPAYKDVWLGHRGEVANARHLHLRARDYNPNRGQFNTTDPLDGVDATPVVANPYHYADNDPVNKVDPTGLRTGDSGIVMPCDVYHPSYRLLIAFYAAATDTQSRVKVSPPKYADKSASLSAAYYGTATTDGFEEVCGSLPLKFAFESTDGGSVHCVGEYREKRQGLLDAKGPFIYQGYSDQREYRLFGAVRPVITLDYRSLSHCNPPFPITTKNGEPLDCPGWVNTAAQTLGYGGFARSGVELLQGHFAESAEQFLLSLGVVGIGEGIKGVAVQFTPRIAGRVASFISGVGIVATGVDAMCWFSHYSGSGLPDPSSGGGGW